MSSKKPAAQAAPAIELNLTGEPRDMTLEEIAQAQANAHDPNIGPASGEATEAPSEPTESDPATADTQDEANAAPEQPSEPTEETEDIEATGAEDGGVQEPETVEPGSDDISCGCDDDCIEECGCDHDTLGEDLPLFDGEEVISQRVDEETQALRVVTSHGRKLSVDIDGNVTVLVGRPVPPPAEAEE